MGERSRISNRLLGLKDNERLIRTNAGTAWTGNEIVRLPSGDILIKSPRPFHGVPEGFPDTIGWESQEITQDMVGETVAVFVGEEHKRGKSDKLRKMQQKWKEVIERMGGIYRILY